MHLLARFLRGALSVRPFLHRLRGVKIGEDVFIRDDVYLENEYPEAVEIKRGAGGVVIEKDSFIGPNAIIVSSGSRVLRIGEGAVIGAGVVVTRDVPAHVFLANEGGKTVAGVRVPLPKAETIEEFVRGLVPLNRLSKTPAARGDS